MLMLYFLYYYIERYPEKRIENRTILTDCHLWLNIIEVYVPNLQSACFD